MYNWYESIKEENNYVIHIGTEGLKDIDFVFNGSTDNLFIGSTRYANYEGYITHSKYYNIEDQQAYLLYEYDNQSLSYIPETQYVSYLIEDALILKKHEEWSLSYYEDNFDSKREEIEDKILKSFSGIERVSKIYSFEEDEDSIHFQVLTSNRKYDRTLMMKLLDLEYEIENIFEDMHLSFDFIPMVYEFESEVIFEGAKLIYQTKYINQYERITSSHTTSTAQQKIRAPFALVPATI